MDLKPTPEFPSFRSIIIEDKDTINNYLVEIQPRACELTFNNIFSWRKTEHTQISKINETIIIISKENGVNYFLPPLDFKLKNLDEILIKILTWMKNNQGTEEIRFVDDHFLSRINRDSFSIILDMPSYDYIYSMKDLALLKGRKYDGKRNHIRYFEKNNKYNYEEINPQKIEYYVSFQDEWCDMEKCYLSQKLIDERFAIKEMLDNYSALNLKGAVIRIDDKVMALTIGEELNKDTFLVNIEKANPKIRGLYQAINQLFCQNNMRNYKYINREEDLGVEGIRKAKLSYHPIEMVKKYRLSLKA